MRRVSLYSDDVRPVEDGGRERAERQFGWNGTAE
jgi:hypothetical protein